jgi:hypothetical protein
MAKTDETAKPLQPSDTPDNAPSRRLVRFYRRTFQAPVVVIIIVILSLLLNTPNAERATSFGILIGLSFSFIAGIVISYIGVALGVRVHHTLTRGIVFHTFFIVASLFGLFYAWGELLQRIYPLR